MTLKGNIILASRSPRRLELLEKLGLTVTVSHSCYQEKLLNHLSPAENVLRNAKAKAMNVLKELSHSEEGSWLVAADTVVVLNDNFLGKPEDDRQAKEMLRLLSGKEHQVFTGFYLINSNTESSAGQSVRSKVRFRQLTEKEINWYVASGEPLDKAGAYGIQQLGAIFVEQIDGSYSNVVGLPICELVTAMLRLGAAHL